MNGSAPYATPTFASGWHRGTLVRQRLSKIQPDLRRALRHLLMLGLFVTPLLQAATPAWSLDQLMQRFAEVERRQARFSETRELALLDSDLTSEGSLSFEAPDHLTKAYDPPDSQSYEITGNRLTIRKADGTQEIVLLDNSPQLLAYIASLRAVLAGDLHQLQRYFDTRLSGSAEAWRLTLTPREPRLARQILRIEITGRQTDVLQFVVIEQGGDRIVTRLHAKHET
jgi:outer membrane lipoprotein-sorting protein